MARKARKTLDSHLVLVTQGSPYVVFRDDNDREAFLHLIEKAQNQYKCEVLAFCCANKEGFQLVLDTKGANISRIMQSITIAYAMYRKSEHRLFEQRYKSYPLYSMGRLKEVIEEVGLKNPRFAGCCFMKDEHHPWMKTIHLELSRFDFVQSKRDSKHYVEIFLEKNGINISELYKNKSLRNQAIFEMRQNSDCTLKCLADSFDLSESNVSKILKKF